MRFNARSSTHTASWPETTIANSGGDPLRIQEKILVYGIDW
jgi:hypothetical protein